MKERYGMIVLGAALIIAVILMFACSSSPKVYKAPCCGEEVCDTYESEVIESIEEPDLTRDYEEPQTGSFDFPMHGEPVGLEGYCACVCCGVYIIDDPNIISEHLKTCCP